MSAFANWIEIVAPAGAAIKNAHAASKAVCSLIPIAVPIDTISGGPTPKIARNHKPTVASTYIFNRLLGTMV
jgi:hypothetical protein